MRRKEDPHQVEIHGLTGEILEKAIKFCYSREIEVTVDIFQELLKAFAHLQMPSLEIKYTEYYEEILKPSNCLSVWAFAGQYGFRDLHKISSAYAFRNFKDVVQSTEFQGPVKVYYRRCWKVMISMCFQRRKSSALC